MFMVVIALLGLAAALAGLWLPLFAGWQFPVAVLPVVAWWWAGSRGLFTIIVLLGAVAEGQVYRGMLPGVEVRDRDFLVSGCVDSFPRVNADTVTFAFRVQAAPPGVPPRLRLTHYADTPDAAAIRCADLLVRLKPAHGQVNPGAFDREVWLYREDIAATGYVRPSRLNRPRADLSPAFGLRLRDAVRQRLAGYSSDARAAALIAGLTVGDRSRVATADWDTLRRSGTTHLVAISGLHVALVAGGVAFLARAAGRGLGQAGAVYPAVAAACVYAYLAGWSVPTSRAALMVVLFVALASLARRQVPLPVLGAVAVSALLGDVRVVLNAGFWMSYLAVAVLLSGNAALSPSSENRHKVMKYIISLLHAQWRLSVGLLLPNLLLFAAWAPLAPLVNLLAIPLFGFVILPVVLLAGLGAVLWPATGSVLMPLAEGLISIAMQWLRTVTDGAGLVGRPAAPALLILLGATLMAVLSPALLPRGRVIPVAGIVLGAWVLCTPGLREWRPAAPPLRVDVLDVGQGTAVLLRTRAHALLVDSGPGWPGGDSGSTTILPFMARAGLTGLDAVLISHADNDHRGGLVSVLRQWPEVPVLASQALPGVKGWRCRRGMRWRWDGVSFEVLHPRSAAGWNDNNASCVLRVSIANTVILLPGDIERRAETVLLAAAAGLQSALVIAPHHGSGTSSGLPFVRATASRFVVHTTAFWNRWHFPAAAVVDRWQTAGSCQLNTALTGALSFIVDAHGELQFASARKAHWSRPAAVRQRTETLCLPV